MMDEVRKQNKFLANSVVNVAGTPVSVVVRSGAPKPDISSVDAFKHTLLTAQSIVYADPAKGGVSGVHFARVQAASIRNRNSCRLTPPIFCSYAAVPSPGSRRSSRRAAGRARSASAPK
jgi:hypothetical protein